MSRMALRTPSAGPPSLSMSTRARRPRRVYAAGNRTGRQRDLSGRASHDSRNRQCSPVHFARDAFLQALVRRSTRSGTRCSVSGTGKTATLGTLATIENDPGQSEIRRENLQRDIAVTGRFEGVSLGTGIALVQKKVADSAHTFLHSRRLRRPISAAAAVVPRSPLRAGRGYRARVYRVAS